LYEPLIYLAFGKKFLTIIIFIHNVVHLKIAYFVQKNINEETSKYFNVLESYYD